MKLRWNSRVGETTNIRLQERPSDYLCEHIKRQDKAGNEQ